MTLTLTYDLDLQSPAIYGHDILASKSSVGSEDRVDGQTDGQTEAIRLPPTLMRSAKNVKVMSFGY